MSKNMKSDSSGKKLHSASDLSSETNDLHRERQALINEFKKRIHKRAGQDHRARSADGAGCTTTTPLSTPLPEPRTELVEELCVTSLVGPCTPLDVLSRCATIDTLQVGDLLVIPNVEAYGLTMSLLAFMGKPAAAEVIIEGDGCIVSAHRLKIRREPP